MWSGQERDRETIGPERIPDGAVPTKAQGSGLAAPTDTGTERFQLSTMASVQRRVEAGAQMGLSLL